MNEHQELLDGLLLTPEFRAAIDAASNGPLDFLLKQMRSAVREGHSVTAAHLEGQVFMLESITDLLKRYVVKGNQGVRAT